MTSVLDFQFGLGRRQDGGGGGECTRRGTDFRESRLARGMIFTITCWVPYVLHLVVFSAQKPARQGKCAIIHFGLTDSLVANSFTVATFATNLFVKISPLFHHQKDNKYESYHMFLSRMQDQMISHPMTPG